MACKLSSVELDELERIFREDPAAFPDALALKMNPTWGGKLLELWKAGLLTSPATHVANFSSNTLFQVMREAERAISSGLQTGLVKVGAVSRAAQDRYVGELAASIVGGREALPGSIKTAVQAAREALSLAPETFNEADLKARGIAGLHVGKIAGKTGRAVRVPFRLLEASDALFKDVIGNQELHRQAYRRATTEGKTGPELAARYDEILRAVRDPRNTSPLALKIREAMGRARVEDTFQEKLSPGMQAIATAINRNPILGVVVPFIRTPTNVVRQALLRTPIVSAYKTLKAFHEYRAGRGGLGNVTDEAARGALGLALMSSVLMLTENGAPTAGGGGVAITGGGPVDPKQRQNLMETGWRPYSLRVGDTYVSYKRVAPISQIVGIAADVGEASDPAQRESLLRKLFAATAENVTNQTFLAGLEDLAMVWADPRRHLASWAKSMESSVVPAGVRAVAGAIDPVQRQADAFQTVHGVPEAIAGAVPFLSRELPAKRTATGTEAEKTTSGLSPFTVSTLKPDADLEREFARIGYVPSQPVRKVTVPQAGGAKAELTDEEYSALLDSNTKASERAQRLIRMPSYKAAPDTDDEAAGTGRQSKAKMLASIFEAAHREALSRMVRGVRRRWWDERQQVASR